MFLIEMFIRLIIFPVFAAHMGGNDLIHKLQFSASALIQTDNSPAVASVPQPVMLFAAIRSLIIYQQHILLAAGNFRIHQCMDILLGNMPVYIFLIFMN